MDTSSASPTVLGYPTVPRLENSFFLKELRSTGRRWYATLAWPLVLQCLVPLLPLLLMERLFATDVDSHEARRGIALAVLGIAYSVVCGAAGWSMGSRVFLDEHRQGTLESLRMIALSPWRWVPQKLLFPLYGLVLVWMAGLPSTALLAVRGHFLPRELAPGLLLAGCMGLVTLGTTLLIPPEGIIQKLDYRLSRTHLFLAAAHFALSHWIMVVLVHLGWGWIASCAGASITAGAPAVFRNAAFFTGHLRQDHGLAVLLAFYLAAALGAAFATGNPASRVAQLLARGGRLAALAVAYCLFLGYTWPGAPESVRLLGLIGLPAALLLMRLAVRWKGDRRGEDVTTTREIGWLSRWTDNPVFIRDLRVTLRNSSLARQLLFSVLSLAAAIAVVSAIQWLPVRLLMGWRGRGAWPLAYQLLLQAASGALVVGFTLAVPALLTYGFRAGALWQAERQAHTLPQLLASPLSAAAIIRGRWAAALLVGLPRNALPPLAFIVGLLVVANGQGLELFLSVGAWLGSLGLILSVGMAGPIQKVDRLRDLGSAVCLGVLALMVEGMGLALLLRNTMGWNVAYTLTLYYTLGMLPLNGALTYLIFRRAVSDLEAMRRVDAE